jgi:hypothetical protein
MSITRLEVAIEIPIGESSGDAGMLSHLGLTGTVLATELSYTHSGGLKPEQFLLPAPLSPLY